MLLVFWAHTLLGLAMPATATIPSSPTVTLNDSERAWLAAHPVLTLSIGDDYAPTSYRDARGQLVGISVDYMQLLADRLGVQVRFEGSAWPTALGKAMKHQVDGVVNADRLDERKPFLNFTDVYAVYPEALVTRKDQPTINSIADLPGRRIAVKRDTSQLAILRDHYPMVKLIEIDDLAQGLALLTEGKADGVYGDVTVLDREITSRFMSHLKFALVSYEPPAGYSRIGLRNDDPMLLEVVNKAIASLRDEDHRSIQRKWFSMELPTSPELGGSKATLTSEEMSWLAKHRVLRVGGDSHWAPMDFLGADGTRQGVAWDYLHAMEPVLGVRFVAGEPKLWSEIIRDAREKKLDMVACLSITEERQQFLKFTRPYLSIPIVVLTRNDVTFVGRLSDLNGRKVAVVEGYAIAEWLRKDHPQLQIVPVRSVTDGLMRLHRGEVYAYIDNILASSYYIGQLQLATIKVAGDTPYTNDLTMGVRDDWPELVPILQKAIDGLSPKDRNAIYQRWISIRYEHGVDYSLLWKTLTAAGVVVLVFVYWNRKLAGAVARRTVALENEVTERKRAEEAIRQARDLAESASRAKDYFLAAASHELRTPLTPAMLLVSSLENDPSLRESVREDLTTIREHIDVEKRLIGDLLDFSALRSGKLTLHSGLVNLHDAITQAADICSPDINRKHQTLVRQLTATSPFVEGDLDRLRQVFWNLLRNAVKFTPEQGHIRVNTRQSEAGAQITAEVADNGVGIASDLLTRIFDPFEQGERKTTQTLLGLGLGLAISKAIVEMHGGVIQASSAGHNQGALFTITLPLSRRTPAAPNVTAPEPSAVPSHVGRSILLVDDHAATLTALSRVLKQDGHQILTAMTAASAIQMANEIPFDLLICDIGLPDGSGLDVMRTLRAQRQFPAIAMSGFGTDADREASRAAGFTTHLTKPVSIDTLRETIQHLLGHSEP